MNIEPLVDFRSFHSISINGDYLIFDRRSCGTFAVSPSAWAVLDSVESGTQLEHALNIHLQTDEERSLMRTLISDLIENGLFKYEPVNHSEQEHLIEQLMRHQPRRIQLLMAQGCNLGCRYCYAWRNGSNQKATLMPFPVARRSVDFLVARSGTRTDLQVTFFGGEPLLNLDVIRQVVGYCRSLELNSDKQFTFELITNGTLLSKEVTDWIVAERFLLFVSIDGWKEMHNHNRPSLTGEDFHEKIVANALYANKEYEKAGLVPVKVRANLTNAYHDAEKVGNYLSSLGFRTVGIGAIEPLPHSDNSPSALTEIQMDELHSKLQATLKISVDAVINGGALPPFAKQQLQKSLGQMTPRALKGITCGVIRNTAVVDNKGNIFPCHRYEGMDAYIVGNVFDGLNQSQVLSYYRKVNGNATSRCHSCWIRDYCAGGCAWLLSAKDGHLADPTERECNRRRKSVESAIWLRQKMRSHFPERFTGEGEIDLDSWSWGDAEAYNDAGDEPVLTAATETGKCGGGCEDCGPTGCSN